MAKTSTNLLLVPGETSWEVWSYGPTGTAPTLVDSPPALKPSEIDKLPAGDLILFFPIKAITALPMQVNTGDAGLFPDLAATHAERLGFRPDPFAGQLTDVFPLFTNSETSTILSVILRTPGTEDLPKKSPKAFDISPRAFPAKGNTLNLWRELGQWVFAIHKEGKLIYCQATASSAPSPDAALAREIRIAIAQLSLQGLDASPSRATVWTSAPDTDTTHISKTLSLQTDLQPRPAPVMPDPLSKLLPADVRAARREAAKRRNVTLAIAAVAIAYVGTAGYLGYQLWKTNSTTKELNARIKQVAPEGEAYALHIAKWDELEYAIDVNHNSVDILNRVARSIPPNSGLRLKTADISPTEIRLIGESQQVQSVTQFSQNLKNNNDLAAFDWQLPEPKQSSRGWEFVYTGSTPLAAP